MSWAPVARPVDHKFWQEHFGGGGGGHHGDGGFSDLSFGDFNNGGSIFNGSQSSNSSFAKVVQKLLIKNAKQERQSALITLGFSIALSLLVLVIIIYDSYSVKEGQLWSRAQKSKSIRAIVHPADVFPFLISIAVIVQGCIFMGVQASHLSEFWATDCRAMSKIIWPALWIVAMTKLTLSLEVTFRSLGRQRFNRRGVWNTPACIVAAALLIVGLFLIAAEMPTVENCPATLVWFATHYSKVGLVLASGVIFTHLLSMIVIAVQLLRSNDVEWDERVAASRVFWCLGINIIVMTLILPFFVVRTVGKFPFKTSKIANVAITLTGILHAALFFLFRANATRFSIHSRTTPKEPTKKKIRIFGPNDMHAGGIPVTSFTNTNSLMIEKVTDDALSEIRPAPPPPTASRTTSGLRSPPNEPSINYHQPSASLGSIRSQLSTPNNGVAKSPPPQMTRGITQPFPSPPKAGGAAAAVVTQQAAPMQLQQPTPRRPSLSVFPNTDEALTNQIGGLPPIHEISIEPPSARFMKGRTNSASTSVTIDIGLRLSEMPRVSTAIDVSPSDVVKISDGIPPPLPPMTPKTPKTPKDKQAPTTPRTPRQPSLRKGSAANAIAAAAASGMAIAPKALGAAGVGAAGKKPSPPGPSRPAQSPTRNSGLSQDSAIPSPLLVEKKPSIRELRPRDKSLPPTPKTSSVGGSIKSSEEQPLPAKEADAEKSGDDGNNSWKRDNAPKHIQVPKSGPVLPASPRPVAPSPWPLKK